MSEIAIIVQARCGSSRLPNKMILPFFEDKSLFEIIINRLAKKYKTIIATTDSERDDSIAELGDLNGVSVFRGSENNVLNRFIAAAEFHKIETIIRVCADNPFINMEMIDSLIKLYNGEDYCSYRYSNGKPTILGHLGLFCEITTTKTLKKVSRMTQDHLYQEHVTNFIYSHPKTFNVKLHDLPAKIKNYDGVRLTVDTQKDFELIKEIYKKLKVFLLFLLNYLN